jgi:aspartate aminotransferase
MKHIEHTRGISFQNLDCEFDCIVSNGAKHSISNILGALIELGDEVIIFSPYWISYPEMIKFCRGVPIIIKSNIFEAFVSQSHTYFNLNSYLLFKMVQEIINDQ